MPRVGSSSVPRGWKVPSAPSVPRRIKRHWSPPFGLQQPIRIFRCLRFSDISKWFARRNRTSNIQHVRRHPTKVEPGVVIFRYNDPTTFREIRTTKNPLMALQSRHGSKINWKLVDEGALPSNEDKDVVPSGVIAWDVYSSVQAKRMLQ